MRILIVGAGTIGYNLAEQLSNEQHDVSVVEALLPVIERLNAKLDVLAVRGNGASPRVLEEAGIARADMVIAVTDRDEMNIIVCMIAREYHVPTRVARVRNPDYTDVQAVLKLEHLGIDVAIHPEELTVSAMDRLLETPGATEVVDFPDGDVSLLVFNVPAGAPVVGQSIADMRGALAGEGFLIAAIERAVEAGRKVIIPHGRQVVEAGDELHVVMSRDMLPMLLPMLYRRVTKVRRIVLYGATPEGRQLALKVQRSYSDVVLIEPDAGQARSAAEELDRTTVLIGDAIDPDVLADARIETADWFVAAGEDDQDNLMAALMARQHGARHVMVIMHEPAHVPIVNNLDIDVVVNPRLVTVGEILRYVRRGSVVAISRIGEGMAEVTELLVEPGAPVAGKPLRDIRFPPDALVGAVLREGSMTVPSGDTVIQAGEKVVIFSLTSSTEKVQSLFTAPSA
jgi:trk system potassium uptake protein TrkA